MTGCAARDGPFFGLPVPLRVLSELDIHHNGLYVPVHTAYATLNTRFIFHTQTFATFSTRDIFYLDPSQLLTPATFFEIPIRDFRDF